MPTPVPVPPEIGAMSFETAMSELEKLVAAMENGGMPLNDLVTNFEKGRHLANHCRNQLNTLERKISVLAKDDGASGEWQEFTDTAPKRNREITPPAAGSGNGNDDLPF